MIKNNHCKHKYGNGFNFTGCNTNILYLFLCLNFELINFYAEENNVTLSSAYSKDKLHMLFRFRTKHSFPENAVLSDFVNKDIVNTENFYDLIKACYSTYEFHSEAKEIQLLLQVRQCLMAPCFTILLLFSIIFLPE